MTATTMMNDSAIASPGVVKWISRIYGGLAFPLGLGAAAQGVAAIMATSRGTAPDALAWLIEEGKTPPAIYGPYAMLFGLALAVLGVLVFRRNIWAAVALLGLWTMTDALGAFVAAFNVDGATSYDLVDAVGLAIVAAFTGTLLLAGRKRSAD